MSTNDKQGYTAIDISVPAGIEMTFTASDTPLTMDAVVIKPGQHVTGTWSFSEINDPTSWHTSRSRYESRYWEAQDLIDELEEQRRTIGLTWPESHCLDFLLSLPNPGTLRFSDGLELQTLQHTVRVLEGDTIDDKS